MSCFIYAKSQVNFHVTSLNFLLILHLEASRSNFPVQRLHAKTVRAHAKTNVSFVTEADAIDGAEGVVPGW